jgi:hypothetical protein
MRATCPATSFSLIWKLLYRFNQKQLKLTLLNLYTEHNTILMEVTASVLFLIN